MDDPEIRAGTDSASGYSDLPGKHVTVNQIVAWNVAWFRKAADLTQEELGERLGWSKVIVSAAERSWDGKRIRQFSADDLMAIAVALAIPVSALLLPPENDGVEVRYLVHAEAARREPGESVCSSMRDVLGYVMSEPSDDSHAAMAAYRRRYVNALNTYFDDGREELGQYVQDITTEDRLANMLERLRQQYGILREILGDNDKLQAAVADRLDGMRQRQMPRAPRIGQIVGLRDATRDLEGGESS